VIRYSFVIVAGKDNRDKMESFINDYTDSQVCLDSRIVEAKVEAQKKYMEKNDGSINDYSDSQYYSGAGRSGLSINLPIDSFVVDYIRVHADRLAKEGFKKSIYEGLLKENNRATIGCIYYEEEPFDDSTEFVKYQFSAATNDMSRLFEKSSSIREWFVKLSKASHAKISYMNLESEGNRIIYYNNKEVDIFLNGESYFDLEIDEFCSAINTFSIAVKDYFDG